MVVSSTTEILPFTHLVPSKCFSFISWTKISNSLSWHGWWYMGNLTTDFDSILCRDAIYGWLNYLCECIYVFKLVFIACCRRCMDGNRFRTLLRVKSLSRIFPLVSDWLKIYGQLNYWFGIYFRHDATYGWLNYLWEYIYVLKLVFIACCHYDIRVDFWIGLCCVSTLFRGLHR